ncbi:MAG: peptidoglycan recognition family protein [Clostridia bacterium]
MINIEQYKTPNFGDRRGYVPDLIVMHIAEGNFEGTVDWFSNKASSVSSHFLIGKDGRIAQFVPINKAAFTQGTSVNPKSNVYFGLSTLPIVVERKTNANYYSISIEYEGFYKDTKGAITPEQFNSTIFLLKHINAEMQKVYNTQIPLNREHIVGHYQINPKTKANDPGEMFPFDEIIKAVNSKDDFVVGDTVRIKETATKYATGEIIPNFVKQGIYSILRIDNDKLLLSDIKSLVFKNDVYKV